MVKTETTPCQETQEGGISLRALCTGSPMLGHRDKMWLKKPLGYK